MDIKVQRKFQMFVSQLFLLSYKILFKCITVSVCGLKRKKKKKIKYSTKSTRGK